MNAQERMRRLAELNNESLLHYYQRACGGWFWPLVLIGLASICVALVVVIRGRGATVGPALVLSVLVTPLCGLFSCVEGTMTSFRVIEMSGTVPDSEQLLGGCGTAVVPLVVSLLFAVPTAVIALAGATIRAIAAPQNASLP